MRVLQRLRGRGREAFAGHEGVSCDPQRLYGGGGFYDGQIGLARLQQISREARRSFRTIAEIYPRAEVSRPMPASIGSRNAGWAAEVESQARLHDSRLGSVAPSLLVRIKDALLWHGLIFVKVGERYAPVYELYRQIDRPLAPEGLAERIAGESIRSVHRSRDAAFLYVGSAGTLNYGHWLVDDLPALAAAAVLRKRYRQVQVIMTALGPLMDATRADGVATALAGASGTAWRYVLEAYVWRFDELHYVTPWTYHPMLKNPAALAYLRSLMGASAGGDARVPHGERLFVNRSNNHRRRLANSREVAETATRFGFREVCPETMTLREQWLAFASARQVVGLMGAAMTNTVFTPSGAELLHLAFEGWPDPFFWDLAAMNGQRYSVLFGSPPSGDDELFTIDCDRLAERLGAMLTSSADLRPRR